MKKLIAITIILIGLVSCKRQEEVWINGCKYIKISEYNGKYWNYNYIPTNICK